MKLDGIATVVKPKRLFFNYYGKDISECSFYLELESIKDSGVYEVRTYEYEELVEVSPAEYKSSINWDSFREYYPESSRIVIRN